MDRYDGRVFQGRNRLGFPFEAGPKLGIVEQGRR
jgi:hypothetical protein